jgi:1-aminocyclopropane-1-carboxylate deaminase/D-cysteine desulfhydrase-like pyridoxal-dependent ACC family enzyme
VEFVDAAIGPELDKLLHDRAAAFRAAGRRPYSWDRHHVRPLAAISYALCLAEIVEQMRERRLEPTAVYISSTGATGSGMALGRLLLGLPYPVRSICPIRWPWKATEDMAEVANQALRLLDLPGRVTPEDIEASEEYIGAGYGVLTPGGWEAMDLLARTEGILLDPVYTSKAMAALMDDVRKQRLRPGQNVVFVHTGGTPAVFAYRDELMRMKKSSG